MRRMPSTSEFLCTECAAAEVATRTPKRQDAEPAAEIVRASPPFGLRRSAKCERSRLLT